MRAVVAFCLAGGAALGVTEGSLHASEQELAALLLAQAALGPLACEVQLSHTPKVQQYRTPSMTPGWWARRVEKPGG
jgi:hypothetical protein